MARYRPALEAALGLPVIDPCQAATAAALGRIALNQTHRPGAPMLDETAKGVFTIAVTPVPARRRAGPASIDSMVDFYEDKGATGLTILGMMGEAGKLSAEESVEVVTRVTARASVPVVVGVSAPGLAAIGALAKPRWTRARRASWSPPRAGSSPTTRSSAISPTWPKRSATSPGSCRIFRWSPASRCPPSVCLKIFERHPTCVMLKHEAWPGLEKITTLRAPRRTAPAASRSSAATARSSCSRR
jgi:4-hydroxy-tetrahydrodipicolinate synthase